MHSLRLRQHVQQTFSQLYAKTACAADIFPIVWEVVRNLECCGLKVIAITCDGASANRKFFKMHKSSKPATGDKSSKPAMGDKSINLQKNAS